MKINFENITTKNYIDFQRTNTSKKHLTQQNKRRYYIPIMDIMGDSFTQSIMTKKTSINFHPSFKSKNFLQFSTRRN